ncbi:hypothetical protein M433DRAFT_66622 [Acidomyces richmondensis BFW]|nr:MAG: hypothetical protein FE78DRAFT_138769 [Acidomyces sp. 'richmondensis']KYG45742.1 hypothetical protein M433DRAFT_66622 [Acidomyces richmondensis BFW]
MEVDGEDSGEDDDESLLNVDFEWFDPQPAVDFHGLKTLLRQLFDADNQLFDLSELTDMILAQPTLGSTVKTEGNESDPFAFLTVINLHQHQEKPVIQQLIKYLLEKTGEINSMKPLRDVLSPKSESQVGLILTERFINMPHQIVPPMYDMILEEIEWANNDGEPYDFTHYLIISKTYSEIPSQLDAEERRPQKKTKKGQSAGSSPENFYFHPEDEVFHKHAQAHCTFEYTKQGDEGASDSKRAFQDLGVKPHGHLILIQGPRFKEAVKAVGEYLGRDS